MSKHVDLSSFNNSWFNKGASVFKIVLWYITNILILKSYFVPLSFVKVFTLRLFGAKIGKNVIIRPGVNIKYPWKLKIGNNCWLGENVWIDNLDYVTLSDNVCISQGAFLFCGNHNYKSESFDLMIGQIVIESGAWVGAKSIICPGVKVGSHAILSVGSLANKDLYPFCVYKGNPAVKCKERLLS